MDRRRDRGRRDDQRGSTKNGPSSQRNSGSTQNRNEGHSVSYFQENHMKNQEP